MSFENDQEFRPPGEKVLPVQDSGPRPHSKLGVVSLVFGILAWTVLPIVGAIIAIVTGHAAFAQIREEGGRLGGRAMAKAGLTLGYLQVVIGIVAALSILWFTTVRIEDGSVRAIVSTPTPTPETYNMGVKMANEMSRRDFELIEKNLKDGGEKDEETIALYVEGDPMNQPEMAVLTTRRLAYIKEGRVTSFDLKDVTEIADDQKIQQIGGYSDVEHFQIEVQRGKGARMRIRITPRREGASFYHALESAWKTSGGGKIEAESKASK